MKYSICIIVFIYTATLIAAQEPPTPANTCSHLVASDGSVYDLTVLVEKGEQVIKGYDQESKVDFTFSFAVCANVTQSCDGDYSFPQCAKQGSAGACMCTSPCKNEWNHYCFGTFSFASSVQPLEDGQGVLINYNSVRSDMKSNYKTKLHLLCDYNAIGMNQYNITTIKEGTEFTMQVFILTDAACPISGGGLSGGTIFLLIVLAICVLYIVVGILINKFSRMKNGREVVPNVEFWISLPGLVADGAKFSVNKITGRGSRSSYSTVE